MLFGGRAGRTRLKASEAGFFRPDAEQAEIDGLAGVNPFFLGIELFITVADLVGGAVGEADGLRAIRSDLPKIEFVVKDDRGVIFGPTRKAEGRFLLDGPIGFAVDKSGRNIFGDVDDSARGGVDGPVVIIVEIEKIAAAGTFFDVVVVVEAVLDFGASAGGNVDE